MSVPLFIKYPAQTAGSIDDRNIETIDILPTIAEVLGMPLRAPVDGIPISHPERSPRKTVFYDTTMIPVEPAFPQRTSALQRQIDLFRGRKLDQPPPAMATHPDWIGLPLEAFSIDGRTVYAESLNLDRDHGLEDAFELAIRPRFISAAIAMEHLPKGPAEVVVAIDGIVRDTGRTYSISGRRQGFQFLITEWMDQDLLGSIELFVVDSTHSEFGFRRMEIMSALQ